MLRKIRITLAAIFYVALTLLFLDFTGTLHVWFGWMAKVQFLPAVLALNAVVVVALVVLTLVCGRIYCSVVCPLGVMQDVIAWMGRKSKKNRYSYSRPLSWLRYTLLAAMALAVALGLNIVVGLLAPYSSYGRLVTTLLQPLYMMGNNVLASMAERADSYAFYSVDVWLRSLPVLIVSVVTFVAIFVLAWRNGRTYCNTLCPVGTVLGQVARFSWLKVRFDSSKCRSCSLCSKNCKASCIDYKTHTVDYSRCVACGDCLESCHFGALSYAPAHKSAKTTGQHNQQAPLANSDRRSFLLAAALATTAALAQEKKKVDGGLAKIEKKIAPQRQTPLTPPGSLSAKNMARRCTNCHLCISECPNQVLRPSGDMLTLMQPVMSFERGYCRPECTRCSEVCPTGAIQPITPVDKTAIQTGHAVFVKKNCVALTDGVECGNCERHCPVGAIEMVPSDPDDEESAYVPAVNESRCIGCGACEHLCPARPFPAIYVEGHEVHRNI